MDFNFKNKNILNFFNFKFITKITIFHLLYSTCPTLNRRSDLYNLYGLQVTFFSISLPLGVSWIYFCCSVSLVDKNITLACAIHNSYVYDD